MRNSSCTVGQALLVLENRSNQARMFLMKNGVTGDEMFGIDSPFFCGFSIPARTATALLRRGYRPAHYRWDP